MPRPNAINANLRRALDGEKMREKERVMEEREKHGREKDSKDIFRFSLFTFVLAISSPFAFPSTGTFTKYF